MLKKNKQVDKLTNKIFLYMFISTYVIRAIYAYNEAQVLWYLYKSMLVGTLTFISTTLFIKIYSHKSANNILKTVFILILFILDFTALRLIIYETSIVGVSF